MCLCVCVCVCVCVCSCVWKRVATFPWVIIDVEAIQLIVGEKGGVERESERETSVKERRLHFYGTKP